MKVKELIEWLSLQDRDDDLHLLLKNDVLIIANLRQLLKQIWVWS